MQKLLWVSLKKALDKLIIADSTKVLAFNMPVAEVTNKYKDFINKGRYARKYEMKHIGNNPLLSVEHYKETNNIALDLLENIDITKIKILEDFELKQNILPIVSNLKELAEELTSTKEIENIHDIQKSLEGIEDIALPEDVRKTSGINKIRRFLELLNDPSSTIATTIKTVNNGAVIIQDITKYYNRIADWCGFPQIPL